MDTALGGGPMMRAVGTGHKRPAQPRHLITRLHPAARTGGFRAQPLRIWQPNVSVRRLLFFIMLAWSLQAVAIPADASTLHLQADTRVRLLGAVDAIVDSSGNTGVAAIALMRGWSVHTVLPTTGGDWQQTPVWYRFTLDRSDPTETYAITWPGIIGRVDLYCNAGSGRFSHQSGGYDARVKSLGDHVLVLPESAYGRACYLRALTGYHLSSPSIMTLARALNVQWSMAPTFGGFFLAIALFNLLMFLMLRRAALLIYAGVVTIAFLVMVTDDSLWRYVPSTPFTREFSHELFGWLYFAATAYFTSVFFHLRRRDRKVNLALKVLVGLSALDLIAGFFPSRSAWVDDGTLVFLIALLVMLVVAGVRAMARHSRGAWFFVVGTVGLCIGVAANNIVETFALPASELIVDLYAFGVAWQALWLTLALADRMSEAVRENEQLREKEAQLELLVEIDELTGIPNRRAFDEHLQSEWNRALRTGTPLGVIMVDIDHFKDYNDTYGHVAGDMCLTKVAQACAAALKRSGDFFARYGGEEFTGIVNADSDEHLAVIAERMRKDVAALALPHPTNPDRIVTISLGVARLVPRMGEAPQALVEDADAALYEAKSSGRNQVRSAVLATS